MKHQVPHSLVQSLMAIPDFATLDEDTLLAMVGESMNLVWKQGSTIFRKGDRGHALYVMLEGECSIHQGDRPEDGEVAHPKAGDSFGEMSLLLNAVHELTATAVTDCEILVLLKQAFENLLAAYPQLTEHFSTVLRNRAPEIRQPV
ncbi:MAG: cyclic nucleotide-binding domain-containing protein [Actinomycetota bacterium]